MDQKRESPSFLNVIANARDIPEGIDPLQERDSPRQMGGKGNDNGLVSPPQFGDFDQIGVKVKCLHFSEVLVLWRPWESCPVCKHAVSDDPSLMPPAGTYVCPHTQTDEYKTVIDRCLEGKGALSTKEFFNLKNGTRVAHVEWMEGDPVHLAKLKKEAEEARARQIYPPDPETAFNRGKKKN